MADSDNGSELSEISSERFRVLEDFYEANGHEPTEGHKLEDEFDDQGFSAADIAAAIRESRQEQDHREGYSIILRSAGSASGETASEVDSQNDRKRERSQAYDDSPIKRRRVPLENLTIQDQQSDGSPRVCVGFKAMEMPEHHLAKFTNPTGLQSVAQDTSKPVIASAQPSASNPSLSHDPEQIAYCSHVDLIPGSSMIRKNPAEPPPRRTFEDSSQEPDDLQGISTASKDVDHSKETPLNNEPVEGATNADNVSNGIEQTPKQTKGHPKHPPKRRTMTKAASRKADRLWEVDTVVTDPNSPLANLNLHAVLMKEEAWTSLSFEQQKKLISMLPNAPVIEIDEDKESLLNILKAVLQTSAAMKADVRLFQDDLRAGRLEPEWQLMARRAMRRRANGDFDEFEQKRRAEIWGITKEEIEIDGQLSEQDGIKGKKESEKG